MVLLLRNTLRLYKFIYLHLLQTVSENSSQSSEQTNEFVLMIAM